MTWCCNSVCVSVCCWRDCNLLYQDGLGCVNKRIFLTMWEQNGSSSLWWCCSAEFCVISGIRFFIVDVVMSSTPDVTEKTRNKEPPDGGERPKEYSTYNSTHTVHILYTVNSVPLQKYIQSIYCIRWTRYCYSSTVMYEHMRFHPNLKQETTHFRH